MVVAVRHFVREAAKLVSKLQKEIKFLLFKFSNIRNAKAAFILSDRGGAVLLA